MSVARLLLALLMASALMLGQASRARAQFDPIGGEFPVNLTTGRPQDDPSVAMASGGRSVVAWSSLLQDGDEDGIYARVFAASGAPLTGEIPVNVTTALAQNQAAAAAAADGRLIVVWVSAQQDGSGRGVVGRLFAADGTPSPEAIINTFTAGDQRDPAVAMTPDGRFVVVWASTDQDGSGFGVYAQAFLASGAPVGPETRVNATTDGDQRNPAVAMAADGRVVVVWQSQGQDGSGWGIYGRAYAADGTAGPEVRVNNVVVGDQVNPAVAAAPDGRFVVVWQSNEQDGNGWGVYGRSFAANGAPGPEVLVNTTTAMDQQNPAVAMTTSGKALVAWDSLGQDGSSTGIYAQRFGANGVRVGGEFQVNVTTPLSQSKPAVAIAANGNVMLAWEGRDGSATGVFARLYHWGNDPPVTQNDSYTLDGPTLNVPAPGVLANDSDPDLSGVTAQVVSGPTGGALTLNADGSFTYTPHAGFTGTDRFTYAAHDGSAASPATVTISGIASACLPRPRIRLNPAVGGGRLDVRVAPTPLSGQPPTFVTELRFGTFQNAVVTLGGQPIASGQVVPMAANTTEVLFTVARATAGQPTTVPFVVVDGCGEWPTFVGGGTGAGF